MKTVLNRSNFLPAMAAVLSAVTAVVYALAQARENMPAIILLLAAGAVLELVTMFFRKVPLLEYIPFACILVGLGLFICLAFDEVGDVLSRINVNGLSVSWIASAVLLVITAIVAALAFVWSDRA